MSEHELKLDTNFFDAVLSGDKPFEVRKAMEMVTEVSIALGELGERLESEMQE